MKKVLLVIFVLINLQGKSQVTNDSCLSAIDLGFVDYHNTGGYNSCFNGIANMDTGFNYATNQNALVNLPYPNMLLTCSGYSPTTVAPSNDVWYKISGLTCDLAIAFSTSDSTNMSIWSGNSCNNLCPVMCYTLLPGAYFMDTLYAIGNIPLYFQICSPNPNSSIINFSLCLEGSQNSCPSDTVTCSTQYVNIGDNELNNKITLSPNPTNSIVNFNNEYNFVLYSIHGNLLTKGKAKTIDISTYGKGIYIIEIENQRKKIVLL